MERDSQIETINFRPKAGPAAYRLDHRKGAWPVYALRMLLANRPLCRVVAAIVVALVLAVPAAAVVPSAKAAAQTVVSLTFDDGTATQYQALSLLSSHGMLGTFYINSSKLGTDSYYMTWAQVDGLAAAGNEIGGHTAYHVDLTQTDSTEAQREVCDDRVNLLNRGYKVTDFAYPFGAFNTSAKSIVQGCGYNSARSTNQFVPPPAESMPPQDPYAIRVAGAAGTSVSLSTLESYVTNVEQNGGGWAPLVFHQICDACDANSISAANFTAFLDWLQPRAASGTVVNTVQQVIGGSVQPAVAGPAAPPPPNGTNALRNASLELSDANNVPNCWFFDSWGTNSYNWMHTTDAHTGSYAERVDVSNYSNGDSKLDVTRDLGFCTPSVTPAHQYRMTAWYKSSSPVSFKAFTRDSLGGFYYWASSPEFPASSSWTQASWVSPQVPDGVNGVSFGLAIYSNGFLTVDDLGFDDAAATGTGDTTPPTVALTAPADGSTVSGATTISANASDDVAVDHVVFLVDGTVVATLTSGPFNYNWDSTNVANGTHTISARAVDTAGNSTTSSPVSVTVANANFNLLQNPSLETASGSTPTCWALGGYGTNTFAWTYTSDAHTGSFAENLNVTSYTNGDRKLLSTQDSGTCAPAATVGHTYTVSVYYKSNAQARIFVYYKLNGVWTFWTSATFAAAASWTRASMATPAVPSGATNLSVGMGLSVVGSVTMDDFGLFDNAAGGDTTPPTVALTAPADGSTVSGATTISANASDNVAVHHVDFLVDGTVVATSMSGPFNYNWDSTNVANGTHTISARAVDTAGNSTTSSPVSVTVANINLLQNPSLETASGSTPTCWSLSGYGTNTFTWTRTSDAHTGSFAENLNVTSYTNGDRKLLSTQDSGVCAPAVTVGHTYTVSAYYKSNAQARIFVYYKLNGVWTYWTSATFAAAASWTKASMVTPAIPSGVTNLSVGMGMSVVGSVTMDDFSLSG